MLKNLIKQIEISDVLQFLGLILLGIGLFLWISLGVSLSLVGFMLFLVGFFGGAVRIRK